MNQCILPHCYTSENILFHYEMEIRYVPSLLFFVTSLPLFFYFTLSLTPHVFSVVRGHPHLSNASDQEALLGFMSAITYDPYQSLPTSWKPHVSSFCEWTGVKCSRRRQRVVSLNVSSMELQGTISPLLGNLSFLRILDLSNNNFHGHILYQLGNCNILFLDRVKVDGIGPWYYRGIFSWYWPMVFVVGFRGK